MKLKKKKKSIRMRGHGRGTHGWGARKKHMGSGHRGGKGMAGTGKRAHHNKMRVIVQYGNKYFGKQGFTSRSTERDKREAINLRDIELNLESLRKKFLDKNNILNMEDYKILGEGEIKSKINIKARAVSKMAKEKIEKAGGTIIIVAKKNEDLKNLQAKKEQLEAKNKE